ncbi:MAG: NAD-glutamate dehydrogenase, partial [Actinobacteria bacterium]|nr:NAD-glutamate dehydrogenase [Actinomycetota bacterium]
LVERVVEALPTEVQSVAQQYFDLQSPEDIVGRDVADLTQMIQSHFALGQVRKPAVTHVSATAPVKNRDGWYSPHTVIQIVTDDMPFLVDSVAAEISREHRSIHLVIHPIYMVKRDSSGRIVDVLTLGQQANAAADYHAESWMCFEVDRETDDSDLRRIEENLARVLSDVRAAVQDWNEMKAVAYAASQVAASLDPDSATFLEWLADDHFTFTGYDFVDASGKLKPDTALGILRERSNAISSVPNTAEIAQKLLITKGNNRSTIHHPVFLDCVVAPVVDNKGKVQGLHRFVGLYSSSAYTQSVFTIPVINTKASQVFEMFDFGTDSHSGKDLLQFLETYPRDQLFQISANELAEQARGVLQLQERRQVRLFARTDVLERFVSILVYFPRDRYTTKVRLRMESILLETFGASSLDYTARVTESALARLHFDVRMPDGVKVPQVDLGQLEQALADAVKFWEDHFSGALVDAFGEEEALQLMRKWSGSFPESFKEHVTAQDAVSHVMRLDELEKSPAGDISVALNLANETDEGNRRFTIYRVGTPVTLSSVLPMLHDLGTEVIDERAYEFVRNDQSVVWIYDFGIGFDETSAPQLDSLPERFCQAFLDTWLGNVDSDGFNALVVHGGLTIRNVGLIRAYAAYLRQAGSPFSQGYLQQVLRANVGIVQQLLALFRARFDPAFAGDRQESQTQIVSDIDEALNAVASLDHDRIMRSSVALVRATIRTNAYQRLPNGELNPVLVFKLNPRMVPDLPLPVPMFEIWVFSPRMEGIHLRFAPVARGGLRWSDRLEDFRTEVLGLVKAQMVKNTVIVPSGAKGGFVVKRGPDPSDRDAWLAEGVACYQMYIRALLDVTDNLIDGNVVPPVDVVRHDSDDPYLVVAADKGTATFSDIANAISLERGFWMGDAFASGGSIGYDHKVMAITARGAWESVKRHFRELGVDCQSQDFTVVGIGDMSGDVFGNGMLLSEHINLVAAFDHRHIFLDPQPNVAASFKERSRLFTLARSSWEDYNTSIISKGGAVFSRTAKSIDVTPQVRAVLGIDEALTAMTPNELISHILKAPVDLLWNGGIGTYIKSSTETHAQVGDKANDGLRINGNEIRARMVGEGGNLGCTQLGRIEAARNGVKLNTDAIDNSAGVDTSDHEVNIKILLNQVVASGQLTMESRNALLSQMTQEVGNQVLRDNYLQNVILEQARTNAPEMLRVHQRLINVLEDQGLLNRAVEYLPTDAAIDTLHVVGQGLTSPELSVLMAYAKIDLQKSDPSDPLY